MRDRTGFFIEITMSLFVDTVSVISGAITIAQISIQSFKQQPPPPDDKPKIQQFLVFLEGRRVLYGSMHSPVYLSAAIRSLEEVKLEAEALRVRCTDVRIRQMLLNLLLSMSEGLTALHKVKATQGDESYGGHVALENMRIDLSRFLAMLCGVFSIEPESRHLSDFIMRFSVSSRGRSD